MSTVASTGARPLTVVHLPCYTENAYQPLLMSGLKRAGLNVIDGGGGGRFLRTALRVWKADVLHFHWIHPYLLKPGMFASIWRSVKFLLGLILIRATGTRIVWTIHNLKNHANKHSSIERTFTRLFARLVDRMIVHCHAARTQAASAFAVDANRIAVIPHGNYIGCYPNRITRAAARDELNLPSSALVFIFFGRIDPYKGLLELIASFRALNIPDAVLLIAGNPTSTQAHQCVADAVKGAPSIHFHPGFVADERVQVFLQASDVVVAPYRDVLTSGSVILAMSFGRACIAPSLGCIPEALDEQGAFLYGIDDPDGVAAALNAAQIHRSDLPAMGNYNFERAQLWNWDAVAAQTIQAYRSVLDG